jgi:O-antigen ligase/tetratricopeptide (TPR) repeat protein
MKSGKRQSAAKETMSRGAQVNVPPVCQPPLNRFEAWLRAITLAGVVAGLLTPAVYAQVTWFAFTSLKVFWLQAVVGLTLPAYIILACRRPEFRPPRSWMMLALLAQFASVALSSLFADDPHLAWWGNLDRMEGLWSLLHFGIWAIMAASVVRTWQGWRRLLHVEIVVGLVAGCVVMLQVPFPKLLGQATDVRISGLFGNPIFSAAYHSLLIFLVAFLWTKEKRLPRGLMVVYLASVATSITAMVLAGSRGAMLGFASGVAVTLLVFGFLDRQRRKAVLVGVLGLASAAALYVAFALLVAPRPELAAFWDQHQNLFHLFVLQDDSSRLDFWRLALAGIRERPLLGWGQCNFEVLFDRHYVPMEGCAPAGADNAHNIVFQTLATTGGIGLAAFLFLWGAVSAAVLRAYRRRDLERLPAAILLGLPVGHLVQLLFNPESPGTLLLCYLVFAIASWLERPTPAITPAILPQPRWRPGVLAFALVEMIGVAIVTAWTVLPAYASEMALLAVTDYRHNKPEQAWHHARQAASVPSPYLEDQLAVDLQLLLWLADSRAIDHFPAWRDLFALDRVLTQRYLSHHKSLRFRFVYARLLHAVGVATRDQSLLNEGERKLREVLQDNPKRQQLMFALGANLAERGQLDEAEQLYRKARDEEPRVGESQFQLGRFLLRYRDLAAQGASYIAEGTRGICPYFGTNLDDVSVIATAFARLGDKQGLRSLVPIAEDARPTPSPRPYWALASYLEQAGMMAERDRILRLGMKHSPEISKRAQLLLQGKVKTLAETEQQSAGPAAGQPPGLAQ